MTAIRHRAPVAIALLALALVLPASAVGQERTVTVSATATLKVANDSASLGFGVSRERKSRPAALRAMSTALNRVIATVQTIPGVGSGAVETGRVYVHKVLRGTRTLYRAQEGIGVTLAQPQNAGELIAAAIDAGATGVRGPTFYVGDTEAAFRAALAAAFLEAKERATVLAGAAGSTLGPALSIAEGSGAEFVGTGTQKAASSPGCGATAPELKRSRCTTVPPPTKPGVSTVTAKVSAVFALQ
jgi:uncharacterized protein